MIKDNGGSAFPMYSEIGNLHATGMSLRDYFAAAALQGMVSNAALMNHKRENGRNIACFNYTNVAECYALADAMIAERNK